MSSLSPHAQAISTAVVKAETELTGARISGAAAASLPSHLAQLGIVLATAVTEAQQVEADPTRAGRELMLWRLREPGYLRAMIDRPVKRASQAAVLLPVVLAWALLGIAEVFYTKQYLSKPVAERPPFFADWLQHNDLRGPVALSGLIVVTVLWLMGNAWWAGRDEKAADEADRVVHRLEAELLPPLNSLYGLLGPARTGDASRVAAHELALAADKFGRATARLGDAMAVVERAAGVVERLTAALPTLEAQATRLAEADTRLARTADEITERTEPITAFTGAVTAAGDRVHEAAGSVQATLAEATRRLTEAAQLAGQTETSRVGIVAAQAPFGQAAADVAAAAAKLDRTMNAVHETARDLRTTIADVNWLAVVHDGLRTADPGHNGEVTEGKAVS
ncbi:hypothetical protein ACWED2_42500 [Amycolatopsis sp. NPDC005003]